MKKQHSISTSKITIRSKHLINYEAQVIDKHGNLLSKLLTYIWHPSPFRINYSIYVTVPEVYKLTLFKSSRAKGR